MCGIFGFDTIDRNKEEIFFGSLNHRGPDNHQAINADGWTLGFCRLAILDTSSRGDQPMRSGDDYLVFNGEIYNYIELKNKYLKDKDLKSSSDSEVLLELLKLRGLKILNELNGMFAFAWYEKGVGRLTLVRDRFGVKPLFWMRKDGIFYFSSETKPLVKLQKKVEINEETVETFIKETVTEDGEESYFKGIYRVMPGALVQINNKGLMEKRKWYYYNDYNFDKNIFNNHKGTIDYFEKLLTDAISIRHRSDVPVAITLSGGLDSTVIYTLAKEKLDSRAQPFTFTHGDKDTDETKLSEGLANDYGDKVIKIEGSTVDNIGVLKRVLDYLEFPIWDYSATAFWETYKRIREKGYIVVIEGHGSDELLGGYPSLVENAWREQFSKGKIVQAYDLYKVFKETANPGLNEKAKNVDSIFEFFLFGLKDMGLNSFNNRKGAFESQIRIVFERKILPLVLRTFDRLTMANSVESRSPFMDFRVVEFARAMPLEYKVNKMGNKAILREILKKYGKDEIYLRKVKMGFAADSPKFFNDKDNKKEIKKILTRFDMEKYMELKKTALKNIDKTEIKWSDLDSIWKILSLQINKESNTC